jgi:hypothetical protein
MQVVLTTMAAAINVTHRLSKGLTRARQEYFRSVLKYRFRHFDFRGLGAVFSKVPSHHKYKLKWEIFDAAIESADEQAIPELLKIFDEVRDPKNALLSPAIDYISGNRSVAIERLIGIIAAENSGRELRRAACFFLLVLNAYPLAEKAAKLGCDISWPHFQFWDIATPRDVEALMARFRKQCGSSYEFFDEESARAFLSRHFDHEVMVAYETCHHPAMRCDFFRLCKLYQTGGSYSDADALPRKNFGDARNLLSSKPLFWIWEEYLQIGNWFMSTPPRTGIYEKLIREAIFRIKQVRSRRSIYNITGPNMIADVLVEHCHRSPTDEIGGYTNHFGRWNIQTVGTPRYKRDVRNWQLYESQLNSGPEEGVP